jgi:predicted dehydrogenase
LEKEKFCDGIIIATPDDQHYEPAKCAMAKGYHVLLEKPMSNTLHECLKLGQLAQKSDKSFMICHVLRYNPLFTAIKEVIHSGKIGQIVSIQHSENIGFYHMAHSFVRGNWRNNAESSPIILSKSCHDLDILLWLTGKKCTKISSYGNLFYFKAENAPENAGDRCLECAVENACPYSAKQLYYQHLGEWPTSVISTIQSEEGVTTALKEGPYGRCVFKCDNDVCDHQVTIMEFQGGISASFHLSAFSHDIRRTIKIMGSEGQIYADDQLDEIVITPFKGPEERMVIDETMSCYDLENYGILADFASMIKDASGKALTSAQASVESHVMAFAAEVSRKTGRSIDMAEFYEENGWEE